MTALSPVFVYSDRYTFVLPPGYENIHLFDGAKFQRAIAALNERGVSLEGRTLDGVPGPLQSTICCEETAIVLFEIP